MENIIKYLRSGLGIADIVLTAFFIFLIIFFAIKFSFSKLATGVLIVLVLIISITSMFEYRISRTIVLLFATAVVFLICLSHVGKIRQAISKFGKRRSLAKKSGFGKFIDREALYNEIYETVVACSRQKIGALITFEKHDDLSNLTKNGTIVNAPITRELLMTIFYPGTRLHDGAVIIKDGMIYAASVYYTPTTKALSGKYGSRHRAAIGISEMSDSVTVVVSEETGRVSIAQGGELDPVLIDEFIETLAERINRGE